MRVFACSLLSIGLVVSVTLAWVAPPGRTARIDFAKEVRPILTARCLGCHGPQKQRGGLNLDDPGQAIRRGLILPHKAKDSPLMHRVQGTSSEGRMPPSGPPLTSEEQTLLRAWIDQGADRPADTMRGPDARHWAYRPLVRPAAPTVRDNSQIYNILDRFVQARLEKVGLSPAPQADRRKLIRRVYLDLVGLPPSPEEVEGFVADPRPDAYERLVEQLLASPGYGERYARHWLDVIHFAETHGHDQDVPREHAWPYRDYLIRAFNEDRVWSQMIEQQLAGDILYPENPDGIVATGLLAAGPWDESSQQSIREDTLDKKQAQNLDRDDMVTTVASAFLSATVHCARCHDHKFDPISQQEYYGLQAVFAGIDRANRPYDPDPKVHRRRLALRKRLETIRTMTPLQLLTPQTERLVAAWEQQREAYAWQVLKPDTLTTAHGSVPSILSDHSVRYSGPRPERDIYTLTANPPVQGITAVRLEVLTDASLPHQGPGRQDNGNLHLNEFRVGILSSSSPAEKSTPVPIRQAVADFNQTGWEVAHALDGNPKTAWGIYPAVGQAHQAVFVFRSPLTLPAGSKLQFTLEQTHGQGHLIGRLRLSVTTARFPKAMAPLSEALTAILAIERSKRTEQQRAMLAREVLLDQTQTELSLLPSPQMVYAAANDFTPEGSFRPAKGCRPVFVLQRGEITRPLAAARPGALSCVPDLASTFTLERPEDEGARRAALAQWIRDPRNVLTWRSMANRLWHYHFGRGIVATPGDLGKMGSPPSHPELLDWLAVELRERQSLKHVHRLIVTSAAYRRAVQHDAQAARIDGDNIWLWRMNRQRLDAESLRDTVLTITGQLNREMGGPSVKHFHQSKGIHVTPMVDYSAFELDTPAGNRRSIYRFLFRTLPDPFFEVFDCPDASQFIAARSSSITALQALALLNDRFMVRQAEQFAARLAREGGSDLAARIELAYRLALGRPPTLRERQLVSSYAAKHGLPNACRVLLNSNEFIFVD